VRRPDELIPLLAGWLAPLSALVDPTWREFYASRGWPSERWLELWLELDHHVIGERPGLTWGFHLCRGNQSTRRSLLFHVLAAVARIRGSLLGNVIPTKRRLTER